MRRLALLLVLVLGSGCAGLKDPYDPGMGPQRDGSVNARLTANMKAFTTCLNGKPRSFFDVQWRYNETSEHHERIHREQSLREGVPIEGPTCWRWLERYTREPKYRSLMEAEAYCLADKIQVSCIQWWKLQQEGVK